MKKKHQGILTSDALIIDCRQWDIKFRFWYFSK